MTSQRPPNGDLHDRAADLIEAYSLDALEPEERAIVNAHLDEGCDDCEEQVSALRSVVDQIPLAVPLRDGGASLKQRVMAEVGAAGPAPVAAGPTSVALPTATDAPEPITSSGRLAALAAPWRPARFASMAASVAVLAVVGLVGWNVVLQDDLSDLDEENEALLATVEEQQTKTEEMLAAAQEDVAVATARSEDLESRMIAVVSVMGSSEQQQLSLGATSEAPTGAWANLLVNPADGTFIILAAGLEGGLEGGYVLWIHASDGDAIPLSFFYVDKYGNGVGHGKLQGAIGDALLSISHEYDRNVRTPTSPSKLERLNR